MIFPRKDIKKIIREARAAERAKVEKFYLAELDRQRTEFQSAQKAREIMREKEIDDLHRYYAADIEKRATASSREISSLKAQVENSNKAWIMLKDLYIRAVKLSSALKATARIKLDKATTEFQGISMIDDEIDTMGRMMENITPKVEKLIGEAE